MLIGNEEHKGARKVPDFTVRLSAGVDLIAWNDHEGAGVSRINPQQTHPAKYRRATVGVPVTMRATIGGVDSPLDAALGGHLFSSDFGEAPVPTGATGAAGQSSVQTFTPPVPGHYLWVMRHAAGGVVGVHLDAEV
jgi:hypothetical protein